jgi:hypothetical protein
MDTDRNQGGNTSEFTFRSALIRGCIICFPPCLRVSVVKGFKRANCQLRVSQEKGHRRVDVVRPTGMFAAPLLLGGLGDVMPEKVKTLKLDRDYKKFLYFIDGEGNVCQKPKSGEGESTVLVEHAVERDNQFLYFIDKDGDVARSPRGSRKDKKIA